MYNQRKCCTFLLHCPWLLISFTMLFLPKCTVLFQSCTNSVVLIYIFLKSCTTIKKLYNQTKKLYIFGTLYLALNCIDNGVCTKMYSFFQTCTNTAVLLCIFLKSCTTIKMQYNQREKLYNQREKLYIFATLSLAHNFIDNGVCNKMYSFFESCKKFCGPHMYIFEKLFNH